MVKQKTTEPIFKKVIEKNSESYGLQEQIIVQVQPWEFKNEVSGNVSKGHTLSISKLKLGGVVPKKSFVFLDPANKELRQAINEAYDTYDAI